MSADVRDPRVTIAVEGYTVRQVEHVGTPGLTFDLSRVSVQIDYCVLCNQIIFSRIELEIAVK